MIGGNQGGKLVKSRQFHSVPPHRQEYGSAYCSDPERQRCNELRAMLEVVRLRQANSREMIEVP
jgi:hypothetical protein